VPSIFALQGCEWIPIINCVRGGFFELGKGGIPLPKVFSPI